MGQYIPALAAIPKLIRKEAVLLWIISMGCIIPFFSGIHLILYALAMFLVCQMVVEDKETQEVDIRLCIALLFTLAVAVANARFFLNLFLGAIFFNIYYLLLCRKVSLFIVGEQTHTVELGFLPSLASGLFIWLLAKCFFCIDDFFMPYDILTLVPCFIVGVMIWAYLSFQLKKARKLKNVVIQEGLGRGDIWVCSIGFAFFGAEDFLIALFLALLLHFVQYKIMNLKR